MTIGAGETILAADIQAIKDDVDKLTDLAHDEVATQETTASTSYTDLATAGPSVTITTGTTAIIFWSAQLGNDTAGAVSMVSIEISGASSLSPSNANAILYESSNADDVVQCGTFHVETLTAGSNTFTLKYRVDAGTGTFRRRKLAVLPIGA